MFFSPCLFRKLHTKNQHYNNDGGVINLVPSRHGTLVTLHNIQHYFFCSFDSPMMWFLSLRLIKKTFILMNCIKSLYINILQLSYILISTCIKHPKFSVNKQNAGKLVPGICLLKKRYVSFYRRHVWNDYNRDNSNKAYYEASCSYDVVDQWLGFNPDSSSQVKCRLYSSSSRGWHKDT